MTPVTFREASRYNEAELSDLMIGVLLHRILGGGLRPTVYVAIG